MRYRRFERLSQAETIGDLNQVPRLKQGSPRHGRTGSTGYAILFCPAEDSTPTTLRMASPFGKFERKKRKSHDAAYLIVLLAILFGVFFFVMVTVNFFLRSIPIPR